MTMVCRFCSSEAVGKFSMSHGCYCHPDDREQLLCTHHAMKATPLGDMVLVEDFTVGNEFGKLWSQEVNDANSIRGQAQ